MTSIMPLALTTADCASAIVRSAHVNTRAMSRIAPTSLRRRIFHLIAGTTIWSAPPVSRSRSSQALASRPVTQKEQINIIADHPDTAIHVMLDNFPAPEPPCDYDYGYYRQRWSRFAGQFGGLAKVDSGFDYAANFSSFACLA